MTEENVLAFVAASMNSVWALELLLFLKRTPGTSWDTDTLIRELRSSHLVVAEALKYLRRAGLVSEDDDGNKSYRYQPVSADLDRLVSELEVTYATKPMTVIQAIVAAPNEKLRIFSDAFKLKD